jgi:hypothetical protein
MLAGLLAVTTGTQEPSVNLSPFQGEGLDSYSLDQEAKLGQQAAASLESKLPIMHEPKLDAYLAKITAELGKHLPRWSSVSCRFTIYEDRRPAAVQPVAMAMPADAFHVQAAEPIALAGGPIFVPLRLLANAQNELAAPVR